MAIERHVLPAPRWKLTAWISAPAHALEPEVAAKIRMSMFRRLDAVLVSSIITPIIAFLAMSRHPSLAFKIWFVLDVFILILRASVVVHVARRLKHNTSNWLFAPCATDLYIIVGTAWCALFGFGTLMTMMTADAPLMMTATFAGSAILGALGVRNPGSPRQNVIQITLIMIPFSIGCFLSETPLISWYVLLGPIYLLTLVSMTRQVHNDFVALIVAQVENRRLALHCALTGLPNRGFFDERLCDFLRDAGVPKLGLSILCIDLDGFKAVNDNFGHPLGDVLLVQVGERLRRLIEKTDVVARLGGDEFAILMPSGARLDAECLATRINRAIAEPFVLSPQVTVTIGASVGIVSVDAGAENIDAGHIMAQADQALYAAKHAGKGTFRRNVTPTTLVNDAPSIGGHPVGGRQAFG